MRCLIVDDEPLAVDLIEDFISKIPFLTLANKCRNAFECIDGLPIEESPLYEVLRLSILIYCF